MTLLIKNVRVLGANRELPDNCDVFVSGEKISAIGNFSSKKADEILDGQGAYLSPGFIDVNTDSDHYLTLFDDRGQEDFLKQGITTIFGGMCGASLAPLLYPSLESVRKWGGSEDKINVDWHTTAEFLATLDRQPLGVNFGTLAGHATIRRGIAGPDIRELTKNEIAIFIETLKKSLDEGAFGMSTNLGAVHAQKAAYSEIKALAQIVKTKNAIYATHLRNGSAGIDLSIDETIKLSKETGVKTLINHFVPIRGAEKDYEHALETIEKISPTIDFNFDIYPFDSLLLPLYTFLPPWVRTGNFEIMFANLQEEWLLPKIKKEMDPIEEESFVVAQAPSNEFLIGKSLREVADRYGVKDGREALIKLMIATKMRGVAMYKNLDGDLIQKAIVSKRALISTNAPSFGSSELGKQLKSERSTSTFTKFLSMAENEKITPMADAIKKITLEPARKFGLVGRGEIKEGNFADLTCFKNGEIKFTIVNGKVAIKENTFQKKYSGKVLRRA